MLFGVKRDGAFAQRLTGVQIEKLRNCPLATNIPWSASAFKNCKCRDIPSKI